MKIKQTLLIFILFTGLNCFFTIQPAFAGSCGGVTTSVLNCEQDGVIKTATCSDGTAALEGNDPSNDSTTDAAYNYYVTYTHYYGKCKDGTDPVITMETTGNTAVERTGIWGILLLAINILTAGIGIAAVGGIVYGSILYASAGGGPEQVKKAKEIIVNVVIGLVAYALMYAFLNFLIPGGLFT